MNSYYHGFSAFGNSLMIQDDDDLLDKDQIREIKGIWNSNQAQGNGERDEGRLHLENVTKLRLLRIKYQRK